MKAISSSRLLVLLSTFAIVWLLHRAHSTSKRDPTSVFFDPHTGYTPAYSAIRRQQAQDFIAAANHTGYLAPKAHPERRKLCVGIPSIARNGTHYLNDAVGSLLEGLTEEERAEVFFVVFVAHSDPATHEAFTQTWLRNLVDRILTYDVSPEEKKRIKEMEAEGGEYLEKGLYDYRLLLKHCGEQRTPYIAIFEDDIVAMDGWYHRTMAGIDYAERFSAIRHASSEFLYLRLFYTEEFFGWNSENWRTYFSYSMFIFSVPMGLLSLLRGRSSTAKRILTKRVMWAIGGLITFAVSLFFMVGRITVMPMDPGISLMPKFGCCSQAMVFPRGRALMLATYFADRHLGAPDVLMEEYASERGELRWAISPSVVQHVGRKSSKMDDFGPKSKYGMSVAEKIWNFGFEGYDSDDLREEHKRVASGWGL